jgi:hypothetical protein
VTQEHQIRKGTRFLHATSLNPRFSIEEYKTLPKREVAQEFIVTRVAKGIAYYRAVYRHSDREELGACWYMPVDKVPVLEVIS